MEHGRKIKRRPPPRATTCKPYDRPSTTPSRCNGGKTKRHRLGSLATGASCLVAGAAACLLSVFRKRPTSALFFPAPPVLAPPLLPSAPCPPCLPTPRGQPPALPLQCESSPHLSLTPQSPWHQILPMPLAPRRRLLLALPFRSRLLRPSQSKLAHVSAAGVSSTTKLEKRKTPPPDNLHSEISLEGNTEPSATARVIKRPRHNDANAALSESFHGPLPRGRAALYRTAPHQSFKAESNDRDRPPLTFSQMLAWKAHVLKVHKEKCIDLHNQPSLIGQVPEQVKLEEDDLSKFPSDSAAVAPRKPGFRIVVLDLEI